MPKNDWDLLGHLASVYQFGGASSQEVHSQSFREAKNHVPEKELQELIEGNKYRVIWSSSHEAFTQLIPFYSPRVLVTLPAYLADAMGLSPLLTLRLMSSLWAALSFIIFVIAFRPFIESSLCWALPLVGLFCGMLEIARFEGADAIACFFISVFTYLYLRKSPWCLFILIVLPLTRSDTIIFSVLGILAWFLFYRRHYTLCSLALILSSCVYFVINYYFDNYGWSKQFYVVNVEYLGFAAQSEVNISIGSYFNAFLKGLILTVYDKTLIGIFIVFIAISSLYLVDRKTIFSSEENGISEDKRLIYGLVFVAILFVVLHFIAFPHVLIRYFVGEYMIVCLAALSLLTANRYDSQNNVL